jgi:threonine/homoserine/homoserine lactone efflux protein
LWEFQIQKILFFFGFFPQFVSITLIQFKFKLTYAHMDILDFLTLSLVYMFFSRLSNSIYIQKFRSMWFITLVIALYGLYQTFHLILRIVESPYSLLLIYFVNKTTLIQSSH